MAGRGFLKSRLAQMAAKESEEPSTESPNESIPTAPGVSGLTSEAVVAGHQHIVRGRRVIIILN